MKVASCVALASIALATPALAMHTLECRSPGRPGFALDLAIGSGGGVGLVTIADGRRELTATGLAHADPRIARGFLDDAGRLTVRIVGGRRRSLIASLDGTSRSGMLRYRGRAWRVRCRWEPQE